MGLTREQVRTLFQAVAVAQLAVTKYFHYRCMVTNPGVVKQKSENDNYKGSSGEFVSLSSSPQAKSALPSSTCQRCQAERPHSQVNHCSYCGRCVDLFDHHCIWVSNCIGLRTYPWFMGYLHCLFVLTGTHLAFMAYLFATVN